MGGLLQYLDYILFIIIYYFEDSASVEYLQYLYMYLNFICTNRGWKIFNSQIVKQQCIDVERVIDRRGFCLPVLTHSSLRQTLARSEKRQNASIRILCE